jgi:Zn-dependent protease
MFPRALRIARIRGVDVRLDPTWAVVAVLVVWSFLARWSVPGRGGTAAFVMAVAAGAGFFGSVLVHELGHAFEAQHRHLHVHGITLFLFGGVTEMDMRTQRPRDEFAVAAIGPWLSLVLASVFGLVTAALDWYLPGRASEVALVLGTLGWINLGLALFNIIPGAPLDGGRVLRAGLWAVTGDRYRAQIMAARAGQAVAITLTAFGMWLVVTTPGGVLNALWFALIGWFMFSAARSERLQAITLRLLEGHTADLFVQDAEVPGPDGAVSPVPELPTVSHDAPVLKVLEDLRDATAVAIVREGQVVALVDRPRAEAALRRLRTARHEGVHDPVAPRRPGAEGRT